MDHLYSVELRQLLVFFTLSISAGALFCKGISFSKAHRSLLVLSIVIGGLAWWGVLTQTIGGGV